MMVPDVRPALSIGCNPCHALDIQTLSTLVSPQQDCVQSTTVSRPIKRLEWEVRDPGRRFGLVVFPLTLLTICPYVKRVIAPETNLSQPASSRKRTPHRAERPRHQNRSRDVCRVVLILPPWDESPRARPTRCAHSSPRRPRPDPSER